MKAPVPYGMLPNAMFHLIHNRELVSAMQQELLKVNLPALVQTPDMCPFTRAQSA
jgi:hypothetical protein